MIQSARDKSHMFKSCILFQTKAEWFQNTEMHNASPMLLQFLLKNRKTQKCRNQVTLFQNELLVLAKTADLHCQHITLVFLSLSPVKGIQHLYGDQYRKGHCHRMTIIENITVKRLREVLLVKGSPHVMALYREAVKQQQKKTLTF